MDQFLNHKMLRMKTCSRNNISLGDEVKFHSQGRKVNQNLPRSKTDYDDDIHPHNENGINPVEKASMKNLDFISKSKFKLDDQKLARASNNIQSFINSFLLTFNENKNLSKKNSSKLSSASLLKFKKGKSGKVVFNNDFSDEKNIFSIDISSSFDNDRDSRKQKDGCSQLSSRIPRERSSIKNPSVQSLIDNIYDIHHMDNNNNLLKLKDNQMISLGLAAQNTKPWNVICDTNNSTHNLLVQEDQNNNQFNRETSGEYETDQVAQRRRKSFRQVRTFLANKRELMKFENVYDSFSDEEINSDEVEMPKVIILPNSPFLKVWDTICSILILYSIIVSPYILAFEIEDSDVYTSALFYLDTLTDILFMVDIVLNFFIAYIDKEDDVLIVSRTKIALHYISGYFVLDLISSIPFGLITFLVNFYYDDSGTSTGTYSINKGYTTGLQRISKFARFYRLLKWTRILRLLKFTNQTKVTNSKIFKKIGRFKSSVHRFLKFLIFFLILMHLTACMWIFIGKAQAYDWESDNWIDMFGYTDTSNEDIYVYSIYFSFGTILTIGYGDIRATSTIERGYLLFYMTIGCVVFSFVLSSLSTIFSQIDAKTDIFNKKQLLLDQMKKEYHINDQLYDKIRKSLKHDFKKWNEDRIKLLDSLPGSLRNNLYLKIHENQIRHLEFFKNQSYDFILYVVPLLKSTTFAKDDMIASFGELIEEMYLIIRGVVGMYLGYKYDNYEICTMKAGEHFGDIMMYLNDQCNYDFKVKTKHCELFLLAKSNFASIKLNFPNAINDILNYSYNQFFRVEERRKAAITHFNNNGNLKRFKTSYLTKLKRKNDTIRDSLISSQNAGNFQQPSEDLEATQQDEKDDPNLKTAIKLEKKLRNQTEIYKAKYKAQITLDSNSSDSQKSKNSLSEMKSRNYSMIPASDARGRKKKSNIKNYSFSTKQVQTFGNKCKNFVEDSSNLTVYNNFLASENKTAHVSDSENQTNGKPKLTSILNKPMKKTSFKIPKRPRSYDLVAFQSNQGLKNQIKSNTNIKTLDNDDANKVIYIHNLNINYSSNNKCSFVMDQPSETKNTEVCRENNLPTFISTAACPSSSNPTQLITKTVSTPVSSLFQQKESPKSPQLSAQNKSALGNSPVFSHLCKPKTTHWGERRNGIIATDHINCSPNIDNEMKHFGLFNPLNMKLDNKDKFLENLNFKIENQGFLVQNKVFVQDYIKDFLGEKEDESNFSKLLIKLAKIEKGLIEFVEKKPKRVMFRISSSQKKGSRFYK